MLAGLEQRPGCQVEEVKNTPTANNNLLPAADVARIIARVASDKKAENIVILDMRTIVNYCDYFVLCSASGNRHVKAVADGVESGLLEHGIKVRYSQGVDSAGRRSFPSYMGKSAAGVAEEFARGHWALLDLGDVVVHIFEADSRDFYGLEHLWQGAAKVEW